MRFNIISNMDDEHYMKQALKEAQKALDADEVPIGAVIVMHNINNWPGDITRWKHLMTQQHMLRSLHLLQPLII